MPSGYARSVKQADLTTLLIHGTPIETYPVDGVPVYVKRDDRCTENVELPNLCKLRALLPVLQDIKGNGIKKVAVYATRASRIGWATAGLCKYLGLKCTVYYPVFVGQPNPPLLPVYLAKRFGADLGSLFVKDSTVCHIKEAQQLADERGEYMLPFGLATLPALVAYREEALTIPSKYYAGGTVVGCAGSGTTLTGVWMAMPTGTDIIGVQVGAEPLMPKVSFTTPASKPPVRIVSSKYNYYNIASKVPPFPCDMHYDAKAWEWLVDNIKQLRPPILFYNMG